ncbi:MAG: hypothetical protein NTW98_03115 [Candidatus Nomurabacteria bacterium]|nr:hypothetical protein [Candidatus Nomurabacteria bacterium]
MKIGIFLETFTDTELEKDPGSIARGLAQSGFNITIFSKNFSQKVSKEFRVEKVNTYNQNQMSYWRESGMQVLIVYSWLSVRYSRMIHAAKLAGLKIILKLDTK